LDMLLPSSPPLAPLPSSAADVGAPLPYFLLHLLSPLAALVLIV
jgi:hypothetical protein